MRSTISPSCSPAAGTAGRISPKRPNGSRKAASLGVRDSQFNLAVLYARGDGVARNLEESYKWFAIAAATVTRTRQKARRDRQGAEAGTSFPVPRRKSTLKAQPVDAEANTVESRMPGSVRRPRRPPSI
ncbi:hypothetical protein F2981_08610 [Sinorhizobium meliloti]|nr:hypothetical protein [Sinorhizobium meliloti]